MGLVCTNIEWVLEYFPKKVFEWFQNKVVDDRRMADLDPAYGIIGETSKTSGNCAYGKCCIDKTKHNSVSFVKETNLNIHINQPHFKSIEKSEGSIFEVVKGKKKVIIDTPVIVANAVYSYAKLNLICFWEFINKYLINEYYSIMEIDTDSFYMAIARDTIDECVKPHLKEEWGKEKWKFLTLQDKTPINFNGHTITLKDYDKRTPGKYKEEFNGVGMICLNSKVYHIWSDKINPKTGKVYAKTSCKGVQKRRNELVREDFLSIIKDPNMKHFIENAGFIMDGLETRTYTQLKKGLNYFYCKRKVLADGVSTTHLDI